MHPRVVFFGYGELGFTGIETLRSAGAHLAAVVVPSNRTGPDVDLVRNVAAQHALPLLIQPPRRAASAFIDCLRVISPDLIVVWSYAMILPPAIVALPSMGAVNVHGGTLPEYRGGHVMQWALINGEREFGVTLHYMDDGIDTGPIIAERRFLLDDTDDAHTVRDKLRRSGAELLEMWWPRIADGTAPRVPQDPSRARHWPMRVPEEGRIAWVMSPIVIDRLVRALCANSPGAYVEGSGQRVSVRRIVRCVALDPAAAPGKVVAVEPTGVRVAAAGGDVLITEAEDGERKRLDTITLAERLTEMSAGLHG